MTSLGFSDYTESNNDSTKNGNGNGNGNDAEPELARRLREQTETNRQLKATNIELRLCAEKAEVTSLYNEIVKVLLKQEAPTVGGIRLLRKDNDVAWFYEKHKSMPIQLQDLLNARLELEHGILLQNVILQPHKQCIHDFCDCYVCTECACVLWNVAFACIPLVYWIPRIYFIKNINDWCLTARVVLRNNEQNCRNGFY